MATPLVKVLKKYQRGGTLIELMIASAIGIIVLVAIGSVFISGQKLAVERSQRLFVIQSINEALRYIKEDAQRAGFNGSDGYSLILSGSSNTISTSSSSLAYTYKTPNNEYTQVSFAFDDFKLKVCVKDDSAPIEIACNPVMSLLDQSRVKVDSFAVTESPLGSSVSSALITLSLQASLPDGSHTQTLSTQIKQRNWK